MVRQNLKQIEGETDVARLQEGIAQMQQMAGQAPPEMKAALDIVLKRAEERLTALSSEKK
jgi:broad specificity phosphatase PhoE